MILAVLQARFSSSRLPGKVLRPICGKPMLQHQIERISRCRRIDRLVVATSTNMEDEAVRNLCEIIGVDCFRGNLEDVLDRFYRAALRFDPEHIVRLTGDCPLTDPNYIDELIEFYLSRGCDYASNCEIPSLPDGLDAEIFSFEGLKTAWEESFLPLDREHVTQYFLRNKKRFHTECLQYPEDLSAFRWTVDEPEDFDFVSQVFQELYPRHPEFITEDVFELLRRSPELCRINARFTRNEGLKKSLES